MRVIINGKAKTIESNLSLERAIEKLQFSSQWSATAVNGTFISKKQRTSFILKDGDTIEILQPAQGG